VNDAGPLLLATRSQGKLWELRPIFAHAGLRVIDLDEAGVAEAADEDGVECFPSFEENALAKARYFRAKTGLRCVADDSGLEIRALAGRPGVHSKRWAGRHDLSGPALDAANNAKLVAELGDAPDREARYVCVAAMVDAVGEVRCRGETAGRITREPRGAGGFGYDPFFESAELGCTFGEAPREAKERVSHRGRAFRALIELLLTRR